MNNKLGGDKYERPQDFSEKPVRLSVNLAPDVAQALRDLASMKGVTISEIVRDAISTEKWIQDKQNEGYELELRKGRKVIGVFFR